MKSIKSRLGACMFLLVNMMLPSVAWADGGHQLTVTAKPAMAGTFNTNSATLVAGETIHLYAYANSNFTFVQWTDENGKQVSDKMDFTYVMSTRDVKLIAEYEYNPANPSNPARNYWNKETGQVIVDDFAMGSLSSAVSSAISGSSNGDVTMLTVAGRMNNNDFGIANNYSNCTLLDLSRVTGVTEVPSYAFDYTNLEDVYLPSTIETIGARAFAECKSLISLTCYAMTPPTLGSNVFSGVPEGLVVYVPAAAIHQYQDADVWKDLTLMPLHDDISNLSVSLPAGTNVVDYANMWLELINRKNDQRMHYVMTDRNAYTFSNVIHNTLWDVVLRNQDGDVFGRIDNVQVKEEDMSVTFTSLMKPQRVALKVVGAMGKDVTEQTQVTWTDAQGNYMAQGTTLSGLPVDKKVSYRVVLPQELAMQYDTPSVTEYVVKNGNNNVVCQLEAIKQVALSGTVKEAMTGQALSGAVISVSQTFAGKYTKTFNTKTDNKGHYSLTVANVPTTVSVAATDYISQTVDCESLMTGAETVALPDVALRAISGAVISVGFTYTTCTDDGEQEVQNWYSDYNNVSYTLYNKTKQKEISQFNVQYPQIVLLEDADEGDVIELTATSRTTNGANGTNVGAFMPVTTTATIDEQQRASATFNLVELGKIKASFAKNGNASVVGTLYDGSGKLVKTYNYANGALTISDLADGRYTLVTMGESQFFNTIYDLAQMSNSGLMEGTDYVKNTVEVKSGEIRTIDIAEVPTFDESKLYYTSNNTSFTVNKPSIVIGNYLTLTGRMDFKPEYAGNVSNVQMVVDLPESCSFVENSVMVGNGTSSYTLNGNRLTIQMTNYTDRVRFCVIPTESGDYAPSAFAQFDLSGKSVTQPIGSANYTAKGLSINVPSTVAKTSVPISGTAIGKSDIEIYDNDVLIGQLTSLANGTWATTCELNEPYNLSTHSIYAKVKTQQGVELMSENAECLYDKNAIEVKTVTMINTAHTSANLDLHEYVTVFDFQNPKESYPAYWYWPNYPDFTFLVDFTNNDTTIVKDVVLYVFTDHDDVVTLYPEYDAKKDKFVATSKFGSYSLPYNVSVDFYAETESSLSRTALDQCIIDVDSISKKTDANLKLLDDLIMLYENTPIDSREDIQKEILSLIGISEPIENNYNYTSIDELFSDVQKSILDSDVLIENADSTIFPRTLSLSLLQEMNLLQFDIDGTLKVETCEGIHYEELFKEGYISFLTDEGDSIYILLTDTLFNYIDPDKDVSLVIIHHNDGNANIKLRANGDPIETIWNFAKDVCREADQFSNLIDYFNDIIKENVINPLNFRLVDYNTTIRSNQRLMSELSQLASNTNNPKEYESCIQAIQRLSAKNKVIYRQIEILNGSLSVAFRIASGVASLYGVVSKMYGLAKDLKEYISLYNRVPYCDCIPSATINLKKRIAATGVARGGLYISGIVTDIIAIKVAIGGAVAAPASAGSSLSATAASVVKLLGQQLVYAGLEVASNRLKDGYRRDINILAKNEKCWDCLPPEPDPVPNPNPTPDPPTPPGGGAPSVKDPSGYVYEGVTSNRLAGVTATAYYKENVEDMYGDLHENIVKWDAAEYAQENPLFTDEYGMYAWDVPNGLWQVKFEKEGYETTYSEWLPVPPPQLDVNIAMTQARQPEVKTARAYEDAVEVEFDKYMMPASLNGENISVLENGTPVEGEIVLLNEEVAYEGQEETFASKVRFNATKPFTAKEVTLTVSNQVESYAGIRMQDNFEQTFTVEQEMRLMECEPTMTVGYGETGTLMVTVLSAEASAGKTLTVKTSSPMIVGIEKETYVLDKDGKAEVTVSGELPGMGALTFTVEGSDLTATTLVNVENKVAKTVANPTASVASGSVVEKGTEVYLYCRTNGATIYYTLDGSCPCGDNALIYDGTPIVISGDVTLKVMADAPDMYESAVAEFVFTVIDPNAIDDLAANDPLRLYPLPMHEKLNVTVGGKSIKSVSLTSLNGVTVVSTQKPTKHATLDVSTLPSGIYIVSVVTENLTYTRRIVKE